MATYFPLLNITEACPSPTPSLTTTTTILNPPAPIYTCFPLHLSFPPNNSIIRPRSKTLHKAGRRHMTSLYCRLSNLSHRTEVPSRLPLRTLPNASPPLKILPVADLPPPIHLALLLPAHLIQQPGFFIEHPNILVCGRLRLVRNVAHARRR